MRLAECGQPSVHPDDTKTYSLFYALLLSICCRYTAAFFFCASSNSRFNSLTIAISLAGSVSATASRQRSRQSLRASWVMMPPKSGRNILVISEMLSALPVQNLSCCANSLASPPLTISIAKRKRSLWPSSPPPLLCATSSGTQSRRASTYLQGNSRVDERSIGHFNGPIPLTKVSSCRRILTAWEGSWFCGRDKRLGASSHGSSPPSVPATPFLQ